MYIIILLYNNFFKHLRLRKKKVCNWRKQNLKMFRICKIVCIIYVRSSGVWVYTKGLYIVFVTICDSFEDEKKILEDTRRY